MIQIHQEDLQNIHRNIETPALLILESRLRNNIRKMQSLASQHSCRLRPHIKTHKSVDIARRQQKAGANGFTTAKLSEAEVLLQHGFDDIFIANQIVHPIKLKRLRLLHETHKLIIGLDHQDHIRLLNPWFKECPEPLPVRIEIDSGLRRCGIPPDDRLIDLARSVAEKSWLHFDGIFTHAGQVYGAKSGKEVRECGIIEKNIMEEALDLLNKYGLAPDTVSVGSTPTVPFSAESNSVNEIRPGNYVFYDGIQLALGSCAPDDCSLFILATVISRPSENRIVIDAGSKSLNLDRGAQSHTLMKGFGTLVNIDGTITRLSEEHGIIETNQAQNIETGQGVLILPNHACAVVNLFENYHLLKEDGIDTIPVSARAKSQ